MTSPAIVVRRARKEDGERVAEMVLALARHEGKTRSALTADAFRRLGFGPSARFTILVAEAAGALQGYAAIMPVFAVAEMERGLYMDDLYVDPGWRGRGLGRLIMQAVARECLKRGCAYVIWNVRFGNPDAVAFYDGIGAAKTDHNCRWVQGAALLGLASG